MLLEALELEAFGCFSQRDFRFEPGLNLILGDNEAGKSTLARAIVRVLFVRSTATKTMEEFRSWVSGTGPACALVFLDGDGNRVRVQRSWSAREASLWINGVRYAEKESLWQAWLGETLGTASEKVFGGTVFVGQDQFEVDLQATGPLATSLENIMVVEQRVETQNILDRLDRELVRLRRGTKVRVPDPGPIARLNEDLAECERRVEEFQQRKARHDDTAFQLRGRREEHAAVLAELHCVAESATAVEQAAARRRQAQRLREEHEAVTKRLERDRATQRAFHEWEGEIGRLESRLETGAPMGLAPAPQAGAARRVFIPLGALLSAVALTMALMNQAMAWMAAAAIGLILCGVLWLRSPQAAPARGRPVAEEIRHLRELQQARLGPDATAGELSLEIDRGAREQARLATELEGLVPSDGTEDDLEAETLSARRVQLQERERAIAADIQALRGRLNVLGDEADRILETQERQAELLRQRDGLEERAEVLALTRAKLAEARKRVMRSASSQLEPQINGWLDRLTASRHARVRLDREWNIQVFDPLHLHGWTSPWRLSAGTQDQVYFATRLALLANLFPHTNPPLFLDDPFVKFDRGRRQAAMRILREVARQRQVLLFSHSPWYAEAADHVIHLAPHQAGAMSQGADP